MICNECRETIDQWQQKGQLQQNRIKALKDHVQSCKSCKKQYHTLLFFIDNENSFFAEEDLPAEIKEANLNSDIMSRIHSDKILPINTNKRGITRILALAAVLLIMLGATFLVNQLYHGMNTNEMVVQFELYAPEARTVALVGDFNQWKPLKLDLSQQGKWTKTIRLKKEQSYLYNFLVDDQIWIPDPDADINVDDGFGGLNSVIKL